MRGTFPRVTHPCATDVLLHPFDLHVLGLPPAFVLSQDQTLKFDSMELNHRHRTATMSVYLATSLILELTRLLFVTT